MLKSGEGRRGARGHRRGSALCQEGSGNRPLIRDRGSCSPRHTDDSKLRAAVLPTWGRADESARGEWASDPRPLPRGLGVPTLELPAPPVPKCPLPCRRRRAEARPPPRSQSPRAGAVRHCTGISGVCGSGRAGERRRVGPQTQLPGLTHRLRGRCRVAPRRVRSALPLPRTLRLTAGRRGSQRKQPRRQ